MNSDYKRKYAMMLLKKIPFTVEQREYEIRILYEPGMINIAVFSGNHPATGLRHQIQISKKIDVKEMLEKKGVFEVVEELISIAREDIAQKRWERLLASSEG